MEMPEGWNRLKEFTDYDEWLPEALDLMKEMAEALEKCVESPDPNIFMPAGRALHKFKEWK